MRGGGSGSRLRRGGELGVLNRERSVLEALTALSTQDGSLDAMLFDNKD
jgi:hypothetical protein